MANIKTIKPFEATVPLSSDSVENWFNAAIDQGADKYALGIFAACLKLLAAQGGVIDVTVPELQSFLTYELVVYSPRRGIIRLLLDDGSDDNWQDDLQEGITNV